MFNNFITSGFDFDESQMDIKSRYQMLNAGILLSTIGLIYGIFVNIIKEIEGFIAVEFTLLLFNLILIVLLRKNRKYFDLVVIIMTTQFTFLFLFLIYFAELEAMKHVWLFTYPIILLYFQDSKKGLYWLLFLIFMLMLAPLQNLIEVKYSLYQVTYLSFVLIIVHTIIYFYQVKMDEAKNKILEQQNLLRDFNSKLEDQVLEKTAELRELNESLEGKVQDKIEELIQKDKILTIQSKQAVMGEMISMIAHQWRQPLSTVTLQISNLQLKKLLNKKIESSELDNAFNYISDTIVYLSQTIDDFKTYFHPNKEIVNIEIHELLQKTVNFTLSRVKDREINVHIDKESSIYIKTYINELIQVVLNIINNAIDAHNESKLKNPIINLSVKDEGSDILIYIVDNAGGIKEENLPKIFEPYFSTKGKNGTGLGLYMSQMIIEKQFNGKIKVKVSENFTTFIIRLPKDIS
ncbi:MAG: HAMP domain-containing histidine kinase [Sulfurimonas sp.]|nr:HAMP domain-containing histidine kinase [Sulfurimonas sp.]